MDTNSALLPLSLCATYVVAGNPMIYYVIVGEEEFAEKDVRYVSF